jgi:hypothetical protein
MFLLLLLLLLLLLDLGLVLVLVLALVLVLVLVLEVLRMMPPLLVIARAPTGMVIPAGLVAAVAALTVQVRLLGRGC